jgi:hypothetical protein
LASADNLPRFTALRSSVIPAVMSQGMDRQQGQTATEDYQLGAIGEVADGRELGIREYAQILYAGRG